MGQAASRAARPDDSDYEDDSSAEPEVVTESSGSSSDSSTDERRERPERAPRGRGRGSRSRSGRGRNAGGRQRSESRRSEPENAPVSSSDRSQPEDDQGPDDEYTSDAPGQDRAETSSRDRGDRGERERPPTERDAEAEQLVAEVLDYFLATMGVVAETYVRDDTEDGSLVFEIEGEDAGLLIGRRGETLQALQFLVRMVVSRQLGRKAYVVIDVEDYRQRRADMLQRLARRTAGRVASSGRSSALDPMPPGERRIVHMSLASNKRVRTESEGEGNQRRVVILPRR